MAYVLHKEKPYHYAGNRLYPCSVSADKVVIDFNKPIVEKIRVECLYTENEIKHRLGIRFIETWDEKTHKVIKKSNKVVSSIPTKNKSSKE